MKKRLLTLILIALIVIWALPLTALAEDPHTHNDITFIKWESTDSLPCTAGNYYLNQDVTLTNTWCVPSGTTNLCLNGHAIIMSIADNVIIIGEGNTLNLYDCNTSRKHAGYLDEDKLWHIGTGASSGTDISGGVITGNGIIGIQINTNGKFTMNGGTIAGIAGTAVYGKDWTTNFVMNGGTIAHNSRPDDYGIGVGTWGNFIMNGGSIIENYGSYGAGVYLFGYFTMNGGEISRNEAAGTTGGGVYIQGGWLTMNGGSISNNTAKNAAGVYVNAGSINMTGNAKITNNNTTMGNAGGVYLNQGTALNMTGGEISNNKATALGTNLGGVYADNCTVKLGGTAKITGNNIYDLMLLNGTTVTIDEDNSPTDGMSVGIKMEQGKEGIFTSNTGYGCKDYFKSNDTSFGVFYINDDNKLTLLTNPSEKKTVGFDSDGGSDVLFQTVNNGGKATEPESPTKSGYTFIAWVDADGKAFNFDTAITSDITLKATWEKEAGPAPDPINYKIIEGAQSTWNLSEDDSPLFRSDADFSKFVRVELDGKVLDPANYTAKSGSTIIELKPAFAAKLAPGKHTINIVSSDGSAATVFYIEEGIANTDGGFLSEATMSTAFITGSIIALSAVFFELKKKKVR